MPFRLCAAGSFGEMETGLRKNGPAGEEQLAEAVAEALVHGREVDQLLDGLTAEAAMMDVLAPAARLLGARWCDDEIDFVAVTIAMSRLHQTLRNLRLPLRPNSIPQGRALLLPVPGEQHSFGLRLVEELLRRDGWDVFLTLATNEFILREQVSTQNYDIVGFSVSGERLIPALVQAIRMVRTESRNRNVRIMTGGVVFASGAITAAQIGADAIVSDARAAVALANRWLSVLEPA